MRIFDLDFADGKRCRCIAMDAEETEAEAIHSIRQGFHRGYLVSAEMIVPPIPDPLPWKREGDAWRLRNFTLSRIEAGFLLKWPGGELQGGKDEVKAAVIGNWRLGC